MRSNAASFAGTRTRGVESAISNGLAAADGRTAERFMVQPIAAARTCVPEAMPTGPSVQPANVLTPNSKSAACVLG